MKKRVRIYQMGGMQAMQNVGNVDSGPSDDELISSAMKMIGEQEATPDDVLNIFVKNGIQPDKASQVITSVVEYINQQVELGNSQVTDSDNRAELEAEEMARQEDAARAAEEEERRDQMYQQMYADEGTTDYSDDEQFASDIIMKHGGLPNKNIFVKNVFALTKKQIGGNPNSNKALDDKGFGQKESGLNAFVKSAQETANSALIKKDAEDMYASLQPYFQDGGDQESGIMNFDPYHNLAHYSDAFEHSMPMNETDIVQAQFGGMRPGQARRMQRRVNRMVGQIPAAMYDSRQTMFPQGINVITMPMMGPQKYYMPPSGSYQEGPKLANIDVRRTGIFGRPKEYTINFAQEAYYNPQLRQDIIKQEQNNVETKIEEAVQEEKASKTNTATTENKEVLSEIEKINNTGNTGTAKAKKTETKKPDTGQDVKDEVSFNTDNMFKPDYSPYQELTSEAVRNNKIRYNVYANQYGEVDGSKYFADPNKEYSYNPSTKKWYKGSSTNPITDKERIETLNRWKSKGLMIETKNIPSSNNKTSDFDYKPWGEVNFNPNFQEGGMTDYDSGLYRFIYGGNDNYMDPQGKITDDPYFQYGGYFQTAGQTDSTPVEILDNLGNVVRRSTLAEAEKQGLRHRVIESNTQTTDANRKKYNTLKELGYNVGDYREGIDYSKVGQGSQKQTSTSGYYNPQVGAMYPPIFGARRRYSPPGGFGYAGSWIQQQGLPTDPRTGQVIGQMPTDLPLTKIDVTKSSLFGRRPKKFSMYYGNYGQSDGQKSPEEIAMSNKQSNSKSSQESGAINPDTGFEYFKEKPFANALMRSRIPGLMQLGSRMYPWQSTSTNNDDNKEKKEVYGDINNLDFSNFKLNRSSTGDYMDIINQQRGPMEGAQFPMAYGGYLPQAQTGLFTTNPDTVGYSNMNYNPWQMDANYKNPLTGNSPAIRMGEDGKYVTDGFSTNTGNTNPEGAKVDYKVKNMYNVDFEKGVNQFNTGVNQALAMFGERGSRKRMADMQNNLTADNLYGSTGIQDRGTYESNSGLFRPDEMGFKGIVRDGGFMQDGGDVYDEDGITWMSEDQIRQFLAEGGELEFIQE
jgi:hypothetical protein